jgi:hypothetical protein
MLNLININNFNDIIVLKPSRDELKIKLNKEKSYKV